MSRFLSGKILTVCLIGAAIAIVVLTVFKIPITNLAYFIFLLACPLLHLFMMKDHGHKDGKSRNKKSCH